MHIVSLIDKQKQVNMSPVYKTMNVTRQQGRSNKLLAHGARAGISLPTILPQNR